MLQWVLTIRNFDICHFSFMSLLNCYPYFHIRHKNDVYRGINDGCRIFPKCATFKRDGYQRLTVLVSSERRRLVGMWITSNYFFFSFAISHNVELIQPPRINFTNVLRAAFSRTNSKIEKRHWWSFTILGSPRVNFINVLRTRFLYELCFGSFFYIHGTIEKLPKQCSYKKFVQKIRT